MFRREHHRRIAGVLQALDGHRLLAQRCLFGGGTAIALRRGEYRESADIDFVVSDLAGYRELRQLTIGPDGLAPLCREGQSLSLLREVRADQYGIRTFVGTGDARIKLEIVFEARIELAPPGPNDVVCGVATLSALDTACTKLLANTDRWRDDAVFGRDLIDLAMLAPGRPLLEQAIAKAEPAYGASVRDALVKAVREFKEQPQRLDACMQALRVDVPKALLWKRMRALVG